MRFILTLGFTFFAGLALTQSNIKTSKVITTDYLTGNYEPEIGAEVSTADDLISALQIEIEPDSLFSYLDELEEFRTRNSGSDTLSTTTGMGASRIWIYEKMESFRDDNASNAVVDYLEFDQNICGMGHHKNVLMVQPGVLPEAGIIILEAHMDSRCEVLCDVDCEAHGMEDNGSGIALVMELARVMSKLKFNRTMVFMLTTGEEQGLVGATAMAEFCQSQGVNIKAVINNDVVGGIVCGETASPPGCPGPGHVDSTQVRLFSFGSNLSEHKSLARFCKYQYEKNILPIAEVPMLISLMSAEDRTGRGGDHIPFRELDYPSVRFTAANENGDASLGSDYHDHQHSSRDVLALDSDSDGVRDSFFVDFNYLKRNAVINGVSAGMIGLGPDAPSIEMDQLDVDRVIITLGNEQGYDTYRVGIRGGGNDFDTIYTVSGVNELIVPSSDPGTFFLASAMVVDENGIESCLSEERFLLISSTEEVLALTKPKIKLLQNRPNPFDEATSIGWFVEEEFSYDRAEILVTNPKGEVVQRKEVKLNLGFNDWIFRHGWGQDGIYYYSLYIDGKLFETKSMVFAY